MNAVRIMDSTIRIEKITKMICMTLVAVEVVFVSAGFV